MVIKKILQEIKDSISDIPRSYLKLSAMVYQSYQLLGGNRVPEVKRSYQSSNGLKARRDRPSYPTCEKVVSARMIQKYQEVLLGLEENRTTLELVLSKLNGLKKV